MSPKKDKPTGYWKPQRCICGSLEFEENITGFRCKDCGAWQGKSFAKTKKVVRDVGGKVIREEISELRWDGETIKEVIIDKVGGVKLSRTRNTKTGDIIQQSITRLQKK